jgi:hypothetical protein
VELLLDKIVSSPHGAVDGQCNGCHSGKINATDVVDYHMQERTGEVYDNSASWNFLTSRVVPKFRFFDSEEEWEDFA